MIGQAISYYREKVGMTKTELSNKTDISPSSLTQYEKGNRNPSEENLILICDALGIEVETLKSTAESMKNDQPFIDSERVARKINTFYQRNDVVLELSNTIFLLLNTRIVDLEYEMLYRGSKIGFRPEKTNSAVVAIVDKVITEILEENAEEITYRIQDEFKRSEIVLKDLLDEMKRNRF